MITNEEKRETYAALKVKLKRALANSFWFEACMLEYAIIEDRTSSILARCNICKNPYSADKKLLNKLQSILNQIGKKHPIISKTTDRSMIEEIIQWRETRNDIVHRACIRQYDETEMEMVAKQGAELAKKIDNVSKKVANRVLRLQNK